MIRVRSPSKAGSGTVIPTNLQPPHAKEASADRVHGCALHKIVSRPRVDMTSKSNPLVEQSEFPIEKPRFSREKAPPTPWNQVGHSDFETRFVATWFYPPSKPGWNIHLVITKHRAARTPVSAPLYKKDKHVAR